MEEYDQLCTEVVEPVKANAAGLKNAVRIKTSPWLDYCTAKALTVIDTTKTKISKDKAAKPFLDPGDPLCHGHAYEMKAPGVPSFCALFVT